MIQVTCGACGAVQEIADADVPPGGKTIPCASCKSRITVPGKATGLGAALPDLPTPRRPSPLAGAGLARPTPKSSLADATDLPAPKLPGKPDPGGKVDPVPSTGLSSRLDAGDLLAPKRTPSAVSPAPASAAPSAPDLVAPKRAATPAAPPPRIPAIPPIGRPTTAGIAPARSPAPPSPSPSQSQAKPKPGGDIDLDDLLAPSPRGMADLPTPKLGGMADLPAPKPGGGMPNLPAPKRASEPDLPTPKRPSEISDLPEPAKQQPGPTDLPAPKGFFDDLPQVAKNQGSTDLPAPKGFFDDIPQVARNQSHASPGLPAPKGFFDDIPQVAKNQSGLPRPAAQPAGSDGPPGRMQTPSSPPPTADDLFNDLTPPPVMTTPPALELEDDIDLGPPGDAAAGSGSAIPARAKSITARGTQPGARRDTAPPPSGTSTSNPGIPASAPLPMLDLGDGASDADKTGFGGVNLPKGTPRGPSPAPTGVSFKARDPGSSSRDAMSLTGAGQADLALDVEETKAPPRRAKRASLKKSAATAKPTSKGSRIVLLVLLLIVAGGGAGFYLYRRHQQEEEKTAQLAQRMITARAALVAGDPQHWTRAQTEANAVFLAHGKDAEAAGIAAQAAYAAYFDDGKQGDQRSRLGTSIINKALGDALSGPELSKAQGLKLIYDGQSQRALEKYLDAVAKTAPGDGNVALYQGWARLAEHDYVGAAEAFAHSIKILPKRDLPALYGSGQARLGQGDLAGARADFTKVLAEDKGHIGAQVGLLAAAETPVDAQREKDLLALLQLKDIDKADPRAVALAWTLAGDDARRGNRVDAARDRYRHAQDKAPLEIAPLRGLAELELREGKLDAAGEALDKALKIAPDDIGANLIAGQLALVRGKPDDAELRITALRDRKPPLGPLERSRLLLLTGKWHESQKRLDEALTAYQDAVTAAGDGDVDAPLAAATLLGAMAAADPTRAGELRARATKLLEPLETKAATEPQVAVSLGIGYLAAGEPAKAETWLRRAVAAKPDNIEAHFQLAEALARQNRRDDAIASLRAAFELDPTRVDVGVALARRYEETGRNEDATALYDQLLAGKDVTLDLRGRAGRFFARTGSMDKARVLGDEIQKLDSKNPAGLYLRGTGFLADGKLDEARRAFQSAIDGDPDALYYDAIGQTYEMLLHKNRDGRSRDDAIRAYMAASAADPTMFNPLAGQGRLHLDVRDAQKALEPLLAANRIDPKDADVQYNLGLTYQLLSKVPEAIAWMSKSLETKPRWDGYLNVGVLYYATEKLAPAAAALSRATVLGLAEEKAGRIADPADLTEAFYTLGRIESDLHKDAEARKAWQTYIDRNPRDQVKVDQVKREMLRLR